MPKRIQLSRAKGWRMPPNTKKVDRSTRWGNPFTIENARECGYCGADAGMREFVVQTFREMLSDAEFCGDVGYPDDLSALRGKNLACWCPIGSPCHADVLLEMANA
jgi:hypothetical protein